MTLDRHPRYKDISELSYRGLHMRIVKIYGRANTCENMDCQHLGYHRFEWANLTDEPSDNRGDWAMLCVYCHRQMDKQGLTPRLG
ncbi:hypothetical protein UFOVP1439_34 [uncultured Caudovirales phage]|uniref:HNHc domain containing protein n=1 Tax=uncultured Caudovirales phage TaxID=2100421 RepID=A0A6J5SFD4_9CAUD|nr:hypothetical protein UFOVP1085_14 [uncultured Caudovirales phage]CAB4212697.1 hypothetical protein UFOVP1439_34 [uncultured Caudovirales phage]